MGLERRALSAKRSSGALACMYGPCPESPTPLTFDPRTCRKRVKDPTRNIFDQIANLAHGVQRATAAQPHGFGFSLVGTLARLESVPVHAFGGTEHPPLAPAWLLCH